jgi:Ca2+-binding RTX toxin-like protein
MCELALAEGGRTMKVFNKHGGMAACALLVALGVLGTISFVVWALVITGTNGDDKFDDSKIPDSADDIVYLREGNDEFISTNGSDYVDAGPGDDIVRMGTSTVRAGTPRIGTTARNLYVIGGRGNDIIQVDVGNHRLLGGEGNDTIMTTMTTGGRVSTTGRGSIMADGGEGNDTIDFSDVGTAGGNINLGTAARNFLIYGGPGDDSIKVGSGNHRIFGGSGNDIIIVLGGGGTIVEGGPGADFISVGSSSTTGVGGFQRRSKMPNIIKIAVGDVPGLRTEHIVCTQGSGDITNIILQRGTRGMFPPGTPTAFDTRSETLEILDPMTGGVYSIQKGPGTCNILPVR